MGEETTERPWESEIARKITVILLALQMVGCAVDLTTTQVSLGTFFCMAPGIDNDAIAWTGVAIWLALMLSWIVGAIAMWRPGARPVYWLLLAAIPIAVLGHQALLASNVFHCDVP